MSDTPYMYLFIRNDLSHPQQIVQTAHAVDELNKLIPSEDITNHMVLFGCNGQDDLHKIAQRLSIEGIKHYMFFEPDIMQHTSIATEPLRGNARKAMKRYTLKT